MNEKQLKNLIKLSHKIEFYLPSIQKNGKLISKNKLIKYKNITNLFLSNTFGGSTNTEATGQFILSNGKMQTENIIIIYSYASILKHKHITDIIKLAQILKAKLNQDSIGITINNKMFLI